VGSAPSTGVLDGVTRGSSLWLVVAVLGLGDDGHLDPLLGPALLGLGQGRLTEQFPLLGTQIEGSGRVAAGQAPDNCHGVSESGVAVRP
jgi:hypothetical protein